MGEATGQPVHRAAIGAAATMWVVACGVAAMLQRALVVDGRSDLALAPAVLATYAAAVASAGAVGSVLVIRRASHRVGWILVGLASVLAAAVAADLYARVGALARPGSLPGAAAVAHLVDPAFLAYFVGIALVLHLTPTGRPLSARWGRVAAASVVGAAAAYVAALVSGEPIDPPFGSVANPFELGGLGAGPEILFQAGALVASLGLVTGAASLVSRYRRSRGDERRQLLWLALAVAPMPLFVAATFAFRDANNQTPLILATGTWLVVIPIVIGLSITRYHLFEVERVVSRTFTYLVLSALLAATFVLVVVAAGSILTGSREDVIAASLATLAAAAIARPARRRIQDELDRRFNRRRYDALAVVDRRLREAADHDVEAILREALDDPTLVVTYWLPDRACWVDRHGRMVEPSPGDLEVGQAAAPVARISSDGDRVERPVLDAVASRARTELDNTRLRAAAAVQLVEVRESRARLASAQLEERERIERDLHDGAQQRLLALAFELRAAELNGDPSRLAAAVSSGVGQAIAAVEELRDLTNGLQPALLTDLGLAAAIDDLARRMPVPIVTTCAPERFSPEVEATVWFVVCEAVTNACKHAAPTKVEVRVRRGDADVVVDIRDDGKGGADPTGRGLRGIRDRTEAAGGTLTVATDLDGTTVTGWLPCPT